MDDPQTAFFCGTYLNSSAEWTLPRRCVDGILSRFVKLNAILLWHGIWSFSNLLTVEYKLSHEMSAWFSLVIGVVGALILFIVQFGLLKLQKCLPGFIFKIVMVIFYLLGVFVTVSRYLKK